MHRPLCGAGIPSGNWGGKKSEKKCFQLSRNFHFSRGFLFFGRISFFAGGLLFFRRTSFFSGEFPFCWLVRTIAPSRIHLCYRRFRFSLLGTFLFSNITGTSSLSPSYFSGAHFALFAHFCFAVFRFLFSLSDTVHP